MGTINVTLSVTGLEDLLRRTDCERESEGGGDTHDLTGAFTETDPAQFDYDLTEEADEESYAEIIAATRAFVENHPILRDLPLSTADLVPLAELLANQQGETLYELE